MPNYTAFGLTIDADLDFPELQVIAKPARSDVLIRNKKPSQTTGFCFTIDAIGTFEITEKHQITYNVRPETDLRNLRLFLLGSCMGALLQQRGYLVLHGNAISTIDRQNTMIFLGNQGVGKSTTAAWHLTQGHRILADDICAITFNANGEALLIPSYPQPKLWQDSAELLGIQTTGLRQVRSSKQKYALPIHDQFHPTPLPISEIIELKVEGNASAIAGHQKLDTLIAHSYRFRFLREMGLKKGYVRQLMQLATTIPLISKPRIKL